MQSKESQIAEFQALYVKAYTTFVAAVEDGSSPTLLKIFANIAYANSPKGGSSRIPPPLKLFSNSEETKCQAAAATEASKTSDCDGFISAQNEEESRASTPNANANPVTPSRAAGKAYARHSPGGTSSLIFSPGPKDPSRPATRVRQPAGGTSSIQLSGGGPPEEVRPSTRVRVAPGGKSSVQLGGPHLEKDKTRKKKKVFPVAQGKPIATLTPREMAAKEAQSSIFDKPQVLELKGPKKGAGSSIFFTEESINARLNSAINRHDKIRLAYMEFAADPTGKMMTPESFKKGAKGLGVTVTDEYIENLFTAFDKSGKGYVGFSGFVRFVNKISSAN